VPVIVTDNLVKQYGRIWALKGVSLSVERGEIFGLLGQNGAGKTTLIKILLGITRATEGSAQLLGEPVGNVGVRKRVGYLPEDHRFPDYHTGASLLDFYGALLEMPRAERRQRIDEVLEMVGLADQRWALAGALSHGEQRHLDIAIALASEPRLLLLDEPSAGMTHEETARLMEDLLEARRRIGSLTIILIEHEMGVIERVTERCIVLNYGRKIAEGTYAEIARDPDVKRAYLGLE
jgi:ABC-2 type transport system ATP-binding protein